MIELDALPIKDLNYKKLTSPFGMRVHPITGKNTLHNGIDLGYPAGTPVRAVADGKVVLSTFEKSAGNIIVVFHGGYYSAYQHLSLRGKSKGEEVKAGEVIGSVGTTGASTGNHLHFGICTTFNTAAWSKSGWIDPLPILKEVEEMTQEQFNKMADSYLESKGILPASPTFKEDLEWAKENGILKGDTKGNMKPKGICTREETIAFIHRAVDNTQK